MAEWWLETIARHQVKVSTLDSYRKFVGYLADDIGAMPVVGVGAERLTVWQSNLLDRYAPFTVLNCRKVCRQAFTEAVKVGLIPANPFDLVKPPPVRRVSEGRALSPDDARRLITAAEGLRWGAALTLLFCQGWRVSEVLGLAWEDVDLDAATAQVRRGASYTPSVGVVLGTTKTSGAEGVHHLAPTSVRHLRSRLAEQQAERAEDWPIHTYGGSVIHPVFTKSDGQLVTRQAITKVVERPSARGIAGERVVRARPADDDVARGVRYRVWAWHPRTLRAQRPGTIGTGRRPKRLDRGGGIDPSAERMVERRGRVRP